MHMQETELMKSCHNFIHLTSNTKKIDLNQIYLTQNSIILCLHNKCLYSITIFYGIWRVCDDILQQSYKTWLHLTIVLSRFGLGQFSLCLMSNGW